MTHVNPDRPHKAKGLRYSLPKRFLRAVPQADGTMAFEFIFLPDEDNTYAIDITGVMDSHTAEVSVDDNGLLKKFYLKADTTVIPAKTAEVVGSFTKNSLDRLKAEHDAKVNALNTEAGAKEQAAAGLQGKITEAEAALDTATLEATNARLEYESVKANTPNDAAAIAAAKLKWDKAEESVKLKQQTLARLRTQQNELNAAAEDLRRRASRVPSPLDGLFDVAVARGGGDPAAPGGRLKLSQTQGQSAPGPVLYAIDEGKDGDDWVLRLRAVGGRQGNFRTVNLGAARPGGPLGPTGPAPLALKLEKDTVQAADLVTLKINVAPGELSHVDTTATKTRLQPKAGGDLPPGMELDSANIANTPDGITVPIKKAKKGEYTLIITPVRKLDATLSRPEPPVPIEFKVVDGT